MELCAAFPPKYFSYGLRNYQNRRQATSRCRGRHYRCRSSGGEAGKEATFGDVLFHGDGDKLTHGSPLIEGATVTGEVVEQRKDKKVIAFKYRRRKGYHRTVGHRRKLTRIKITGISLGGKTSESEEEAKAE